MKLTALLTSTAAALALFAGAPALAQDEASASHSAAQAELPSGPEGPALWKVADEDTTIYLFGTVHILPKEVVWYDREIADALRSADTFVSEIPMDPASEAAMQEMAMSKAMLPAGTTLRSLLTEEQTTAYEAALGGLGVPPVAFDQMKPWMAGLTVSMLPLLQQGYSPDSGVEKVLLGKVGETRQDALETAEFQLGIFDNLPQEAQIAFLMEAVEDVDEAKAFLDSMVTEWAEGDADALAALMNEGMDDPVLAEKLLFQRNANWAEWIETRLATPGTVFIAVGAGHLAGEKSVQDYLAKREITVERIQ
jgi:uncharacterized protein YbaP (TraB family)